MQSSPHAPHEVREPGTKTTLESKPQTQARQHYAEHDCYKHDGYMNEVRKRENEITFRNKAQTLARKLTDQQMI